MAKENYMLPENIFLVMAAMVPGKKLEINEGIRLLSGKPRIDIPLKKKEEDREGLVVRRLRGTATEVEDGHGIKPWPSP